MPRELRSAPGSLEEEQQLLQALGGSRASLLLKLSAIAPYHLLCIVVRTVEPQDGSIHESYTHSRSTEERELWALSTTAYSKIRRISRNCRTPRPLLTVRSRARRLGVPEPSGGRRLPALAQPCGRLKAAGVS